MTRATIFFLTSFCLILASCGQQNSSPATGETEAIQFENTWIREAPPGMQMLAGYMTVRNNSDKDAAILSASSEAFAAIEMHKTEVVDGTARMIEQEKLLIPAGDSLELSPGGYHLMLMMPTAPLKAGHKVTINLQLEGGSTESIEYEVRNASGSGH